MADRSAFEARLSRELIAERWAGTLTDIADIAAVAIEAYHATGTPKPHVSIGIKRWQSGQEEEFDFADVETMREEIPALQADIETIYEANIMVWEQHGPRPLDDQHVHVTFSNLFRGVTISVDAPKEYENFVITATDRLSRAVEQRELPVVHIDKAINVMSGLMTLVSVFILAVAQGTAWTVAGLVLVTAGACGFGFKWGYRSLFPAFELLPEDGVTRSNRVAKRAVAFLGGMGQLTYVAVAAAIAALLLRRLFN
jgi:hypothetical protein